MRRAYGKRRVGFDRRDLKQSIPTRRLVVGCLPSASQKLVVIGISATPQDKLRLIGGFEIDRIEIRHGDNDVVVLDHHNEAL